MGSVVILALASLHAHTYSSTLLVHNQCHAETHLSLEPVDQVCFGTRVGIQ